MIQRWLRDERGAIAAEYILLLGLLAGGVALGAYAYGSSVATSFQARGDQLQADAAQ